MASPSSETLAADIAELDWYHTLELAPGIVTPGWFDTRPIVDRIPLPRSLADKRCLDVGTFDGFWAFEMERRGAAEVVAIDVLDPAGWDWPVDSTAETIAAIGSRKAAGRGFEIAAAALGSAVQRLEMSVYELNEAAMGRFDVVYLGSLLLHLRDPVRALEQARSVCDGLLVVVDAVDASLSAFFRRRPVALLDGRGRPWWWKPSAAGLASMVRAGGFEVTQGPFAVYMPPGKGYPPQRVRPRSLLRRTGREQALIALKGDPHAALAGRPI